MEGQEEEHNMLNAFGMGMHRHTKAAAYADRRKQQRDRRMQRPGAHGFTFSGEFPEVHDTQPVMANDRRRCYTAYGMNTSDYRPVTQPQSKRFDIGIDRYGMRLLPAITCLVLMLCAMGWIWGDLLAEKQRVVNQIDAHQRYIAQMQAANIVSQNEIDAYSSDVNIQQEAVRIGMVSSKGEARHALYVPETAVLGPGVLQSVQSLATLLGQ